MKYVMLQMDAGEVKKMVPVIFPDVFVHSYVAEKLMTCLPLVGAVEVRSAGFVNLLGSVNCFGGSETLGVDAHPDDARIIETYDYLHGIT